MASPARWEVARSVVLAGGSLEDAAAEAGIPLSTVQKRSAEEGWRAQRAEAESYQARVRTLKASLLQRAEEEQEKGGDCNADRLIKFLSAWKMAEAAYPELRKIADIPKRVLLEVAAKVVRVIVDYLGKHDPTALRALQPHLEGISAALEAAFGG